MIFRTENAILEKKSQSKEDSGIGVENVKKRLLLHYPNRHLLKIDDDGKFYKLQLEILL